MLNRYVMAASLWYGPGAATRPRRVTCLLIGVLVLSAADLAVTLTYLRSVGLAELNPIAAWLIRTTGSTWVLSAYKVATVGLCVTLLHRLRRYFASEAAAWIAIAMLVGMSLLWHQYARELESPKQLQTVQADLPDNWLRID